MANYLTIARVILAYFTLWLLFSNNHELFLSAIFLTILVIVLDGVDGYVARKFNETTKFGSVFDILCDRIVENAYWMVFAALGWIGVWIPIVVLSRGIITDGIRGMALAEGYTAFGDKCMITNPIGHFLTASRFSRAAYGTAKVLAFVFMIIAHIPPKIAKIQELTQSLPPVPHGAGHPPMPPHMPMPPQMPPMGPTGPGGMDMGHFMSFQQTMTGIALTLTYIAVALCIIRGIPVLLEAKKYLSQKPNEQ